MDLTCDNRCSKTCDKYLAKGQRYVTESDDLSTTYQSRYEEPVIYP